ncbi:MAG: hypothetical protein O2854_08545 [Chloroflexi bacterium]|nr:hypothetical protein [Chloroflexota bacterium]
MKLDRYGYYLFLGYGDYHRPDKAGPDWTSAWNLKEWERRLDRLQKLGTNILYVFMMGKELPFPSQAFPEIVEKGHTNVENEFFQQVLDSANKRGIEVIAVFATTGHAGELVKHRPHLEIKPRPEGSEASTAHLRAFPKAEAERAIHHRAGTAQVGSGILCHHQKEAQKYPLTVITECLTRYKGFSGVVLHPPEFVSACFCKDCQAMYKKATGNDLMQASDDEARRFFMDSNLEFQKNVLEPKVDELLPGGKSFMFTIPWMFEGHFEEFERWIDKDTIIVDWDYDVAEERMAELQGRLKRYGKYGHEVWFMPSSGFAYGPDYTEQEAAVRKQVSLAEETGVNGVVYFMGPVWTRHLEPSSYFLHGAG